MNKIKTDWIMLKNKYYIYSWMLLSSALITSCSSIIKTATSKTRDIYGSGVIQKPVMADLEVKDLKVSATAEKYDGSSLEIVKHEAVSNALKIANAHILIEPTYETIIRGGRVSVTVTGFPGIYKNFKLIKAEDVPLLNVRIIQDNSQNDYIIPEKKKNKTWSTIGYSLGIAALLALAAILPSNQ